MVCKWVDVCSLRKLEGENKISGKWKEEYCLSEGNWRNCKRYKLEEEGVEHEGVLPAGGIVR